jgi:CheY-like chemotaxis protein
LTLTQLDQVRVAPDGPGALTLATAFKPQVVLLDLGSPVMDGYEVAGRLQASGVAPITVAVTGYGQDTDRVRSDAPRNVFLHAVMVKTPPVN